MDRESVVNTPNGVLPSVVGIMMNIADFQWSNQK
jgi:hypothetical protein